MNPTECVARVYLYVMDNGNVLVGRVIGTVVVGLFVLPAMI